MKEALNKTSDEAHYKGDLLKLYARMQVYVAKLTAILPTHAAES